MPTNTKAVLKEPKIQDKSENIDKIVQDREDKLDKIVGMLEYIDQYYSITARNLGKSFLLGIASAFGTTVGLAIVVTILGFIIKWIGGLPVVGHYFLNVSAYLPK